MIKKKTSSRNHLGNNLIGIPTLNEKLNIASLVLEIFSLYPNVSIFIVDDNSQDGSNHILSELKKLFKNFNYIIRPKKSGVGSAHLEIIDYAYVNNFDYLVTLDADYTHQPKYIEKFIAEQKNQDLVIGSRFLSQNGVGDWIWYRKYMTLLGHFLTKYMLGIKEDASGSFRCYNLNSLDRDIFKDIRSKGYGFFIESMYLFSGSYLQIKEIPIILPKRTYGESKMSLSDIGKTLKLIINLKIKSKTPNRRLRKKRNTSIDKSLLDPQDWDSYWIKQKSITNLIYYYIAFFYRLIFIKSRLEHFLIKYFKKGSKILHAGCGTGHVDSIISQKFDLSALDISKEAIAQYEQNVPHVKTLHHSSIFNTGFEGNSFDGIYNLGVMEHFTVDEILEILTEMKRILKINGSIVLFWPHRWGSSVIFLKFVKRLYRLIGKDVVFHPKEISLMHDKRMISTLSNSVGLRVCDYHFSFRDLFVQTVICLKKVD